MGKADKYKGTSGVDTTGSDPQAARALSADLRKHVRKLVHAEPLSADWVALIDHTSKVGSVAYLEAKGGKVNTPGNASSASVDTFGGRAPPDFGLGVDRDAATLWESGSALAVRYLLEEGKLNLCTRLLVEYKRAYLSWLSPVDAYAEPDVKWSVGLGRGGGCW
jgi:hypothetical protein